MESSLPLKPYHSKAKKVPCKVNTDVAIEVLVKKRKQPAKKRKKYFNFSKLDKFYNFFPKAKQGKYGKFVFNEWFSENLKFFEVFLTYE